MANRFWVGGTGTWDNLSILNWSTSSGGIGGATVPTTADNVFFDANSGTGTCTTATGATCNQATLNSSTLGLTLGADFTMASQFNLTLGTLDLNNFTLTAFSFASSNSNARTVAFGTGKFSLFGSGASIWFLGTATNLTVTGTPTVDCTYSGAVGTRTLTHGQVGPTEANSVSFNITAGTDIVTVANTSRIRSLNFTGFSGSWTNVAGLFLFGNLTVSSAMTVNAGTGLVSLIGTLATQQITTNGKTLDFPITQSGVGGTVQLQDNLTMGSTRTFTLTSGALDLNNLTLSTGLFSSNNSNVRSVAFGTGNITITGNAGIVWTTSTATNFTYTGTPTVNLTYAGAVGTRTINTGLAGGVEANSPNFNVSAGIDIVLFTATARVKNVNFTGFSGAFSNNLLISFGNLTFSAAMTVTAGANATTFSATSGTQQITTNGKTLDFPLTFNGIGGTFAFQDALIQGSTRAFTMTNGTVKLKDGTTNTVGSFTTSGTNVKFLQSTVAGTRATISQTSGTIAPNFLNVKDIVGAGGAVWNAYTVNDNADAANNSGWNFGGNFMPLFR